MSIHNIYFYGEMTKIILQLSSNTLLICSYENAINFIIKETELIACKPNLIKGNKMQRKILNICLIFRGKNSKLTFLNKKQHS